jgi:tetratricopeptide (TPR) repeat protein
MTMTGTTHGRSGGAPPRSRLLVLVPPVVAALTFLTSLPGDFVYDDIIIIEDDPRIRGFDLERIFTDNYWGAERHDASWRPLTLLSFALNCRLGLGDAALGFHIINVLLNALVALIAFFLLEAVVGDRLLAALGASIYGVLPIHTEAVANIVGRAELLSAAASLAALTLAFRDPGGDRNLHALFAGALVLAGLMAKESAAVTIPLLVVIALVLRRPIPWRTTLASVCALGLYAVLRQVALGDEIALVEEGRANLVHVIDNPLAPESCGTFQRVLNALRLVGLYAWKTAVPLHLSADYSYAQIPVLELTDPSLWATTAALGVAAAFLVWFFLRRAPGAAAGPVFFVAGFLVTSNVLFPIGTIFAERLAFLPSFGFVLFLSGLSVWVSQRGAPRVAVVSALSLLVAVYGLRSAVRSLDWRSVDALYTRTVEDAPHSARAHDLAAEAAVLRAERASSPEERAREHRLAHEELDRALAIYPENGFALGRKAGIFLRQAKEARGQGDAEGLSRLLELAEAAYDEALKTLQRNNQSQPSQYYYRGETRLLRGRTAEAVADFDVFIEATEERRAAPNALAFSLRGLAKGILSGREGSPDSARSLQESALEDFDRAIEIFDGNPEFYNNRGNCRNLLGDLEGAAADYRRGAELCEDLGLRYHPSLRVDTAFSFQLRLKEVYTKLGDAEGVARATRAIEEILESVRRGSQGAPRD